MSCDVHQQLRNGYTFSAPMDEEAGTSPQPPAVSSPLEHCQLRLPHVTTQLRRSARAREWSCTGAIPHSCDGEGYSRLGTGGGYRTGRKQRIRIRGENTQPVVHTLMFVSKVSCKIGSSGAILGQRCVGKLGRERIVVRQSE
jgi:hypothetical protein